MSELDRALDAALRELVGGEGPPDLRRRVLDHIHEPAPRPAMRWPVLAAAAAIAVAVAGVALLRTSPDREMVGAAAPRPAPSIPASPARFRPAAAAPRPAETGPDLAAAGDLPPIDLAPLGTVTPIGDERIAVDVLTIERIEIEPLAEPQP